MTILGLSALLACSRSLSPERAAEMLRTEYDTPEPVYWHGSNGTRLGGLAQMGLVSYKPGDFLTRVSEQLSLTPEGERLGLDATADTIPDPSHPYVSYTVRGKLCDIVFGEVATVQPIARPDTSAFDVAYTLRHANPTELLARIRGTALDGGKCDSTEVYTRRAVFVRVADGWHRNRPPAFPESIHSESKTEFDYDDRGRLVGAVTRLKTEATATDPDGDSVTHRWTGWLFRGDSLIPAQLEVSGNEVKWRTCILMGEPGGGVIELIASDPWGDSAWVRFCFRGGGFGC
jgi:hypothetical protein